LMVKDNVFFVIEFTTFNQVKFLPLEEKMIHSFRFV
jgi:hypothetical protein